MIKFSHTADYVSALYTFAVSFAIATENSLKTTNIRPTNTATNTAMEHHSLTYGKFNELLRLVPPIHGLSEVLFFTRPDWVYTHLCLQGALHHPPAPLYPIMGLWTKAFGSMGYVAVHTINSIDSIALRHALSDEQNT